MTRHEARLARVAANVCALLLCATAQRAVAICTGELPDCGDQCLRPQCSAGKYICVPAAGRACNDGDVCTTGDFCTSSATCVGPYPVTCPAPANATPYCSNPNGCNWYCNPGYSDLRPTGSNTCVPKPDATITLSTQNAFAGTAGLSASVPVTSGATYAWSISGGGVITGGATTSTVTFSATATPSLT